jgi:hypothetical protein
MDRSCLGSCGSAAACQNARKGAAESTPPWLAWLASYTSGGAGKEKMSTAHIRTSSFLVSLLCVSHLIVYLISCACRFSFSPRWAEYQFLSPEINNTHPAEHLLPPPLCLSLVTVQFPSTIPSLSYGKASHDSRLGISQNGKLTAAAARPVSVRFFNSWRWTVRPIKCASFTLFSFPFLFFSFFSFQLRSFVFFFKRGGTAFQNVNGTLWN